MPRGSESRYVGTVTQSVECGDRLAYAACPPGLTYSGLAEFPRCSCRSQIHQEPEDSQIPIDLSLGLIECAATFPLYGIVEVGCEFWQW